jgi:hypothetical protein
MALEAELRSRVEQSLRELEEVVGSLHHVKRLADSQHASTEQLVTVAAAMEDVGAQFRSLLESVGQSGAVLKSAVDAVKAADPAAVIARVEGVGEKVSAIGQRVDAVVQLGEFNRGELGSIRAGVESIPGRVEAAARAQAAAIERMENAVAGKIEALEKRVGTAIMAAWVAAAVAGIAAAMVGFLR